MFKGKEAARTELCECDTLRTLREEGDAERATEGSWGFVLRVIRIQGLNGVVTGAPPMAVGRKVGYARGSDHSPRLQLRLRVCRGAAGGSRFQPAGDPPGR